MITVEEAKKICSLIKKPCGNCNEINWNKKMNICTICKMLNITTYLCENSCSDKCLSCNQWFCKNHINHCNICEMCYCSNCFKNHNCNESTGRFIRLFNAPNSVHCTPTTLQTSSGSKPDICISCGKIHYLDHLYTCSPCKYGPFCRSCCIDKRCEYCCQPLIRDGEAVGFN